MIQHRPVNKATRNVRCSVNEPCDLVVSPSFTNMDLRLPVFYTRYLVPPDRIYSGVALAVLLDFSFRVFWRSPKSASYVLSGFVSYPWGCSARQEVPTLPIHSIPLICFVYYSGRKLYPPNF